MPSWLSWDLIEPTTLWDVISPIAAVGALVISSKSHGDTRRERRQAQAKRVALSARNIYQVTGDSYVGRWVIFIQNTSIAPIYQVELQLADGDRWVTDPAETPFPPDHTLPRPERFDHRGSIESGDRRWAVVQKPLQADVSGEPPAFAVTSRDDSGVLWRRPFLGPLSEVDESGPGLLDRFLAPWREAETQRAGQRP